MIILSAVSIVKAINSIGILPDFRGITVKGNARALLGGIIAVRLSDFSPGLALEQIDSCPFMKMLTYKRKKNSKSDISNLAIKLMNIRTSIVNELFSLIYFFILRAIFLKIKK